MSGLGYFVIDEVLRLEVTRISLGGGDTVFEASGRCNVSLPPGAYQFVLYGPDHVEIFHDRTVLGVPAVSGDVVRLVQRAHADKITDGRWAEVR